MVTAAEQKEKRKQKRPYVLVVIPGFPPQEPGRRMVWDVMGSARWAAVEVKRLKKLMPEYEWLVENLTWEQAGRLKRKPFSRRSLGDVTP